MSHRPGRPRRYGEWRFWLAVVQTRALILTRRRDASERVAEALGIEAKSLRQAIMRFKKTLPADERTVWDHIDKGQVVLIGVKWQAGSDEQIAAHVDATIDKALNRLKHLSKLSLTARIM